jgi:hypothetical protein
MKNSDVPRMALHRAVELCNGLEALGDALMVSTDRLERMLSGEDEVPHAVFTQAVGMLLEATSSRAPKRSTPDSNDSGRKGPRH